MATIKEQHEKLKAQIESLKEIENIESESQLLSEQ